jgi:rod shape determining protein RodA
VTDTLVSRIATSDRPKDHMDYGLFGGLSLLGLFGAFMVYSATKVALATQGYNSHYYLDRQGPFVVLGIAVMYIISRFDYRRFDVLATPFYVGGILSLLGVYVVGSSALGAQRWYSLGFITIQPSEFTVLFLVLAIATYCERRPQGLRMYDVARLLMMAGVPLVLIVAQPDLGTAIIIVLVVGAMLVVAGVPPRFMSFLALAGSAGVASAIFLDFLKKYQLDRFIAFFNQNSTNPALYNLIYQVDNAKNAIGSGGLYGAGVFKGLQTVLGFVPEQQTDFIFTAIGEQLGFIGSVGAVLLMGFVAWRMWMTGRHARDTMGQLLSIGIFVFYAFSVFENIGMTMGLMPMTGIPLPLLSYGGSATLVFYAAGGVVLSVSRRRA